MTFDLLCCLLSVQFSHFQSSSLYEAHLVTAARSHPPTPCPAPQVTWLVALDHIAQNYVDDIITDCSHARTVGCLGLLDLPVYSKQKTCFTS